jgi:YggT family protein
MQFLKTFLDIFFRLLYFAIIARALMSWFSQGSYKQNSLQTFLKDITDPVLLPIQRLIPPIAMIDFSPLIAILLIRFIQSAISNSL